jgi:hypothetical protein
MSYCFNHVDFYIGKPFEDGVYALPVCKQLSLFLRKNKNAIEKNFTHTFSHVQSSLVASPAGKVRLGRPNA